MKCAACSAPVERGRTHCAICGHAAHGDSSKTWDREAEAAVYEDIQSALSAEEALLAVTRGRLIGSWRGKMGIGPQALLLCRYANLGLTDGRLMLQPVQLSTGHAAPGKVVAFPHDDVHSVAVSDGENGSPAPETRLVIELLNGESFRIRTVGRLARGAREMAEVWNSLSGKARKSPVEAFACAGCRRALDRAYRFCPYCGHRMGE